MEYITGTTDFALKKESAVTLGKFDGLHRGHKLLVDEILRKKKEEGLTAVLFTFDRSPNEVFGHRKRQVLMTNEERKITAEKLGIDVLIECPFIPEIYSMPPEKFIYDILVKRLKIRYIAVGTNFRFGSHAKGDAGMLQEAAKRYGFTIDVIDIEMCHGIKISSSYVREKVLLGKMREAQEHLGYRYSVSGTLSHKELSDGMYAYIPTEKDKILPPDGFYEVLLKDQNDVLLSNGYLRCEKGQLFLLQGKKEAFPDRNDGDTLRAEFISDKIIKI